MDIRQPRHNGRDETKPRLYWFARKPQDITQQHATPIFRTDRQQGCLHPALIQQKAQRVKTVLQRVIQMVNKSVQLAENHHDLILQTCKIRSASNKLEFHLILMCCVCASVQRGSASFTEVSESQTRCRVQGA